MDLLWELNEIIHAKLLSTLKLRSIYSYNQNVNQIPAVALMEECSLLSPPTFSLVILFLPRNPYSLLTVAP